MQKLICKDYEEMSRTAADLVAKEVQAKPDMVLGLPTGSTPVGMYRQLISMVQNGTLDFSQVTTFNLDEYYPIDASNPQSYHYFMDENFFNHINIDRQRVHILDGRCEDVQQECAQYDARIRDFGGIDLQLLGIGGNGHIAFNEPDDFLDANTHLVSLTAQTVQDNARFFESEDQVPTQAVTLGMQGILSAKKIIILASGKNKAKAVSEVFTGKITTQNPASLLAAHRDVIFILDEAAAGL